MTLFNVHLSLALLTKLLDIVTAPEKLLSTEQEFISNAVKRKNKLAPLSFWMSSVTSVENDANRPCNSFMRMLKRLSGIITNQLTFKIFSLYSIIFGQGDILIYYFKTPFFAFISLSIHLYDVKSIVYVLSKIYIDFDYEYKYFFWK